MATRSLRFIHRLAGWAIAVLIAASGACVTALVSQQFDRGTFPFSQFFLHPSALGGGSHSPVELVVTTFHAPRTGVAGARISGASSRVSNTGETDAPPFRLEYYLSRNPDVTIAGIDTGYGCDVPGLPAGTSFRCSGDIGIPSGLLPGRYYLAVIADPRGAVVESSRSGDVRLSDSGPIAIAGAR